MDTLLSHEATGTLSYQDRNHVLNIVGTNFSENNSVSLSKCPYFRKVWEIYTTGYSCQSFNISILKHIKLFATSNSLSTLKWHLEFVFCFCERCTLPTLIWLAILIILTLTSAVRLLRQTRLKMKLLKILSFQHQEHCVIECSKSAKSFLILGW